MNQSDHVMYASSQVHIGCLQTPVKNNNFQE